MRDALCNASLMDHHFYGGQLFDPIGNFLVPIAR